MPATAITISPATKITAADVVSRALRDRLAAGEPDGVTAAEIAERTGLARSTVGDALRKLATAGTVVRFDHERQVLWSLSPHQKGVLRAAAKKAANKAAKEKAFAAALKETAVVPSRAAETASVIKNKNKNQAVMTKTAEFADVALPEVTVTPTGRRAKGVLDAQVLGWLKSRRSEMFGPYDVAKGVNAKTGAVHPALERLLAKGLISKPRTERPVRYQAK